MKAPSPVPRSQAPQPAVYRSLKFKVAAAFCAAVVLLALITFAVLRFLVEEHIAGHATSEQRESDLRLAQDLRRPLDRAQILANNLANLALHGAPDSWSAQVPGLVRGSGLGAKLAAVGIWPEPSPGRARASRLWTVGAEGRLRQRGDYNHPDVIAYHAEAWYTPARFLPPGRCYWTPAYRDALQNLEVVSCALAMHDDRGFAGVATVSLQVSALDELLRRAAEGQSGYALLADRENRLLGAGGAAAQGLGEPRPRNLAELAQGMPAFNPLALSAHRLDQAMLKRASVSGEEIATLVRQTRQFSQGEAQAALALIRGLPANTGQISPAGEPLELQDDAFLKQTALARVLVLDDAHWKLVRVSSAREGAAAAASVFTQTLALSLAGAGLSLLIAFAGFSRLVLHRLTDMRRRLSAVRSRDEAAVVELDASRQDEIGAVEQAYNARVRELREAVEQIVALETRLVSETGKRGRNQLETARQRERLRAVLADTGEAVILIDPNGLIEDMNAVAERLCGLLLQEVRNQPLTAALRGRMGDGSSLPDFAAAAMKSGTRIEHTGEVFLQGEHLPECELRLVATPLRQGIEELGAVLVFKPVAHAGDAALEPAANALPGREACEQRVQRIMEGERAALAHTLLCCRIHALAAMPEPAREALRARVTEALAFDALDGEVFQLGHDGFAIVLEEDATAIVDKLRAQWSQRAAEGHVASNGASFSLGRIGEHGQSPQALLQRLETACAEPARNAPAEAIAERGEVDDGTWARRIRAGLNEGFLHLTTQWLQAAHIHMPQGAVYAVSVALEDEEGFWAEPSSFMRVAEAQNLAAAIDCWTLSRMGEILLRDEDTLPRLAFCVLEPAAAGILDGSLLDALARLLQQHEALPPDKLCFAIGSAAMRECAAVLPNFCTAVRAMGCKVGIELRLGGGMADLDRLRRIPADILRLDASRFANAADDALDQTLGEALVRVARILDRRLLVSALSDDTAVETWRRRGADYLQGAAVARNSPVLFSQASDSGREMVVVPFTRPRGARSAVPAARCPASG